MKRSRTSMLDQFAPDVVAGVNAALHGKKAYAAFSGAHEAADAVVSLMKRTIKALPPEVVVQSYVSNKGSKQGKKMWDELHTRTIARLADGARTLATIWDSAWIEGGGDKAGHFSAAVLNTTIDKMHLRGIYMPDSFIESSWLKDMDD
jgi:hypothetical protein